jgi:cyclic di-GMP phosphodiesterase
MNTSPAAPAAPPAGVISLKGFMPDWAATSRVLIMDDNDGILKVLTRLLQHAGVGVVRSTPDPIEGLKLYAEFAPDLILLDRHMPGLDGFEVLERLALTTGDAPVPVVMLTGDQDQSCRTQALTLGASDFLLKPFDSTEVLLRVRALLETRRLQRRLAEHNQQLEEAVAERTRELEASQVEMLQRLAIAADLRDDETGQHTQRVGHLAGRLALALGLGPKRADLIARAAPLHDIGKIGVSDAILRKPGKLTDDEFRQMKDHATVGARILEGGRSELIRLAELIARHHHERWDGTGYSAGLAGEAIPLEARIVAVVDFFDALTHERPYRGAVAVDRTLDMIRESIGTHFDSAVALPFIDMINVEDAEPVQCELEETRKGTV